MKNSGTTSQVAGIYAEFQAAVNELPRCKHAGYPRSRHSD